MPLAPSSVSGDFEAEFGGDYDLLADRSERLADEFLIGERTVRFRCVEEGDSAVDGTAQQSDHVPSINR